VQLDVGCVPVALGHGALLELTSEGADAETAPKHKDLAERLRLRTSRALLGGIFSSSVVTSTSRSHDVARGAGSSTVRNVNCPSTPSTNSQPGGGSGGKAADGALTAASAGATAAASATDAAAEAG